VIDRRCAISLMLTALSSASLPSAGRAQQSFQRFIPFLIDLPGWTGPPPAGTEEERKGGRVITASRSYLRGDARFNALIISGAAALAAGNNGVHVTVGGVHKSTSMIDGFQVATQSDKIFVLISITVGPNAMFNLFFNNVSENEAMTLAQKFDWKAIQALAN
jgi:hypothetical protein